MRAEHPAPCIFDEVQNTPSLLSYLQSIVDEADRNGMYILTGSRQMELQESITQSLAGRTAIVDLLPLSLEELSEANISLNRDEAMFMGGLPRIHARSQAPQMAYADYFRTYVERDVRKIINVQKLREFEIFVRLLAARVGQLVNYASLANDIGVSAPTIRDWISMLEASYIIFTLHPYRTIKITENAWSPPQDLFYRDRSCHLTPRNKVTRAGAAAPPGGEYF